MFIHHYRSLASNSYDRMQYIAAFDHWATSTPPLTEISEWLRKTFGEPVGIDPNSNWRDQLAWGEVHFCRECDLMMFLLKYQDFN